jgi:hypothetical protein
VKLTLLKHFLSGPLLDPDEKDIEFADLNTTSAWRRKGIPWLEGRSFPSAQQAFKRHVFNVLTVDRYFHVEGLKIVLNELPVAFTFCVGLGSALRFVEHVRW